MAASPCEAGGREGGGWPPLTVKPRFGGPIPAAIDPPGRQAEPGRAPSHRLDSARPPPLPISRSYRNGPRDFGPPGGWIGPFWSISFQSPSDFSAFSSAFSRSLAASIEMVWGYGRNRRQMGSYRDNSLAIQS